MHLCTNINISKRLEFTGMLGFCDERRCEIDNLKLSKELIITGTRRSSWSKRFNTIPFLCTPIYYLDAYYLTRSYLNMNG